MHQVGPAFEIVGNTFETRGTSIRVTDSNNGTVEFNRFSGRSTIDIAYFERDACSNTLAFNDIENLRVVNAPGDCPLEARYNWWGNAVEPSTTPPQADGAMAIDPWLTLPPEQLPKVVIAWPPSGSVVRGNVIINGTAESKDGTPINKVQTSKTRFDWDDNATATGQERWTLRLDASNLPTGPFSLWVRSCSAVDCGVPARLDLAIAGVPTPPIAILRASSDVVLAGENVTLDGRNSYSPQGRQITGYSFSFGNGNATPWGTDATSVAVFKQPGTYTASLQVRDAAGLSNTNTPSVLIYVKSRSSTVADGPNFAPVPAPLVWETVLAGLVGITLVRGLRRNR
ncbi:MAG: PKD domain-containing protein [Euryarchaeota archaeon]|nr:PKD domain-containing protein [Euryarchaeota archaeon]